ncbi:SWIRM domain-containing protein FUN19 [Nakaseomyces bracarensis]|uniref:SWIRM domain-containing protein FUN19 n=1 Tax=Nakaseomyces bracarensis TaxID=273131 RepID=A0ABR4NM14_9SACH
MPGLQSPQLEHAELHMRPHLSGGKSDRNCSIDSILNSSSDSFNIPSPPLSPKFVTSSLVPQRQHRSLSIDSLDLNSNVAPAPSALPMHLPSGMQTVDMQTENARKLSDDIYEFLTQYRMLDGLKRKLEYPGPSYNSLHPDTSSLRNMRRHRELSPRHLATPVFPHTTRATATAPSNSAPLVTPLTPPNTNPFYYNTRYHHYTRLPSPVIPRVTQMEKPKLVPHPHVTSPPTSPTKKRKTVRSPSSSQFQQHHNPNPNIVSVKAIQHVPQYVPGVSWEKLPDYSPPLSTLPESNRNCLKIEWKGNPMDLSVDPLRSKLHPAELVLASILRLPCDLYLDSKKRLFLEKVYKQKKGMPFRKTDAQKACKIDVNKASRLYSAYEKVGWLDNRHFEKYMKDIVL